MFLTQTKLHPNIIKIITSSNWSKEIQKKCIETLEKDPEKTTLFDEYFAHQKKFSQCIPLFIFHEEKNIFLFLFANKNDQPNSIGEPDSILAYFRQYGLNDNILCSDCYGQLSCSACAIEIMGGNPENNTPLEEEFDMLDIDQDRPKTQFTRLSCQTKLGTEPLVITIRKANN